MTQTITETAAWVIDTFEGHLYTDDPVDTGGATRHGITLRTLQAYRRLKTGNPHLVVTKTDVRNLSVDEAIAIAVFKFAVRPGIDLVPDWRVRLVVFDYGFHSGPPRAVRELQRALGGLDPDGEIGPKTLAALAHDPDPRQTAWLVLTAREEFMQAIMERRATQRRFMLGWWKRTTQLQRLISEG